MKTPKHRVGDLVDVTLVSLKFWKSTAKVGILFELLMTSYTTRLEEGL